MVTAKTQHNLKNAQEYFEEHLCVGDYYDQGQRVAGEWIGLGAERLGLSGKVRAEDFLRLCENEHPGTGEQLTPRQNTIRTDGTKTKANRRIFYDFTFSPPKSVSIVGFLGNDQRIFEAHNRAVQSALKEFEAFAATRVRVGGVRKERLTGNFLTARFTHDTSRALDPHLHTHCIAFNATFDPIENRWKALENYELLRARKFAENSYYHEFARELKSFGYRIQNRARGDFEIEGVSEELCKRFSKRDNQIDEALKKLLETKPELAGTNLKDLREQLATTERTRKQKDLGRDELQTLWNAQLTKSERESLDQLQNLREKALTNEKRISVAEAVQWAEEHLFDRNSVVLECQLWQEALGRARGENFSISELTEFTRQRGYVRDKAHPNQVTLREVLMREWEIVQTAREGVAAMHPLVRNPHPISPKLNDEQRTAIKPELRSRAIIFEGSRHWD
jgi:conjugative relaxase-like TrwC/TraI family protein